MIEIIDVKIKDKNYEILDFGTLNNDPTRNQQTIQYAIDAVSNMGGGHINLIDGVFPVGPIELKSNIDLHIPRNCYLKFVKDKKFYHTYMFDYEGMKAIRCNSPVSIHNCENVSITGEGVIDGCGFSWRPCKDWKITLKDMEERKKISNYFIEEKNVKIWYPSESSYLGAKNSDKITLENSNDYYDYFRPVLISIYKSNKVKLDSITSMNSPAWNIHPLFSTNLKFNNLKVKNEYYAQNGDGIDIESCKNVEVSNSEFAVGDDGICLKSGKNKEARKIKVPSENIFIHDNYVYHGHGGIVIGSEMSRGIKNVYCENNTFIGTDVGIRFKSAIGRGGVVSNISFVNTYMVDILKECMIFDMSYSLYKMSFEKTDDVKKESKEDIPYFKDIKIINLKCNNAKKFLKINGINSDTISDIHIENANYKCIEFLDINNCSNIELVNINGNISNVKYKKIEKM